ncbi:MAG: hypothetical protein HQ522_17100 [Bacteroidetes bacterium]|nr:hypothetical protein [Bacteroidota bacterium]
MTTEKIDPIIKQHLFSTKTETVILAINSIKRKGNKLYLPILFDLLNSQPEKEIEDEIKQLLATIKNKETIGSFMNAVQNDKYKPILKTLLTVCWQNGLDFSDYMPIFIDLIINSDWEIAFEAFTIIDNFEFVPEQNVAEISITKIEQGLKIADEQKAYFLEEVLKKIS